MTLASIAAGGSDAYLRSYADAVVAFRHPVILSFGHEMNGTWYSWGDSQQLPATFVAAWRHIVDVFRAAGAANVTWLWTASSIAGASSELSKWWPGSAWVSWVGVAGYYYHASDTFSMVFGSTIADIRTFSSAPVLIAETAVGTTANRESQIAGLFAGADFGAARSGWSGSTRRSTPASTTRTGASKTTRPPSRRSARRQRSTRTRGGPHA